MAFLTELDVVNAQLATMGEAPLNELTDDHPYVAAGLRILKVANYREQAKGWWFNIEELTLSPDPITKSVYVPEDVISVDALTQSHRYAQRGRRLYNITKQSYAFDASIKVKIIRFVTFEDLPGSVQMLIQLDAVKDFQLEYDADRFKAGEYAKQRMEALMVANAEHTRQMKTNMFSGDSMLQKFNMLGYTPALGGVLSTR
jgi:hypothetical protein